MFQDALWHVACLALALVQLAPGEVPVILKTMHVEKAQEEKTKEQLLRLKANLDGQWMVAVGKRVEVGQRAGPKILSEYH